MKMTCIKSLLKKDKEFLIQFKDDSDHYRIVVVKTVYDKNKHKSSDHFIYKNCYSGKIAECLLSEITEIISPITNAEMFTMWTNWNSMKRIDLDYADKIKQKIKNTLAERSYVKFGTGKFESYDYSKMKEIMQ